ncbi:CPBP family intramembrane glutamic endopeptidase [Microtetraspora fusca]|uniref:CPBP family intramembrane glutamic endopeptidase n=1 Tax=Microtetraspora fusca TaxID=1997 RepID=A0ABW6UXH5_MICFU|nr:type II CAAX endopeptidase family protein [Microtetraspora fusca]
MESHTHPATTSAPSSVPPVEPSPDPSSRRRRITVFAVTLPVLVLPAVAFAVSRGLDLDRISQAPVAAQIAAYSQALMPALAALIACLCTGGLRGFDWGFHRVPWRTLAGAWALPVAITALAYGTAWLTGLAGFDPGNLQEATGLHPILGVLLGLLPGIVPYIVLALGEQLGWSSLLATRMAETRSPDVTAVIVGLAWAAFHVPLMLFVPGAVDESVPLAYALAVFTVNTITLAFPLVWLRLRTRSIWPVLVLHATGNAATYFVAEAMTATEGRPALLLGEGGALPAISAIVVVFATRRFWRGRPGASGRSR